MTPLAFTLFDVFAFVFGACIGSFLNVVVYRLPLGLSVNEPRRSFCPRCKTQIPFHQNIPCISWLLLRGKCACCGGGISFRYFAVELLSGLLFLLAWMQCNRSGQFMLLLPHLTLIALLLAATFIDFDHFIIPDEITIGGTAVGVLSSFAVPMLMGEQSHWKALLWSLAGAACGFAILWGVVELGKLAFGKKKLKFEPPAAFSWTRLEDDADFAIGEEKQCWSEIFARESDQLIMEGIDVQLDQNPLLQGESTLRFFYNRVLLPGRESTPLPLDDVGSIVGKVRQLTVPREAMGFGDVKFIACIGAFLGWEAAIFTIIAASVAGSIVGIIMLLLGRRDASGRIPFGPYLALGALIWMFTGPAIIDWYLSTMLPA